MPVRLIYLYRDDHDACFLEELEALAARYPRLPLPALPHPSLAAAHEETGGAPPPADPTRPRNENRRMT